MKYTKSQLEQLSVIEPTIRVWIESGIHPHILTTALSNAFVHGDSLTKGDFEFTDEVLGEIYDGIEILGKACQQVK